jgi:serine/threonine protein kinase
VAQTPIATVGNYEIVRPLGEGGMAQVYLCVRRGAGGFQKRVVLKVLHSRFLGEPGYVEMFLAEARLLARLHHPNIVDAFEVECAGGIPYLAMEYVNGPTLTRLHRRARRSEKVNLGLELHLVSQICRGLQFAHGLTIDGQPAGVIHHDVSSQNIVIDAATGLAKLVDFGVAQSEQDEGDSKVIKGKPPYMAPEVLLGGRGDARADIYSVGVLLYRIVTDRFPFSEGPDGIEARCVGRFPKPSEHVPEISPALQDLIVRMLQPDVTSRPSSAEEVARALDAEVDRMGVDRASLSAWIHQLFPGGEQDWSKRYDAHTAMDEGSAHRALGRLVTEKAVPAREVRPVPVAVSAPPSPRGGWMGAAGLLLGVALGLTVGWTRSPTAGEPALLVEAAEELLSAGDFGAARLMNEQAGARSRHDPALEVRVARQREDIERKAALRHARELHLRGEEAEARRTLLEALQVSPADPDLLGLLDELDLSRTARLQAAHELLATDPALALERAMVLESEFPDEPAVKELIATVRSALAMSTSPLRLP